MSNTLKPIVAQHGEHNEWLNKLAFYKEELALMQNRLEEIAKKNTSRELMANVEQFQNQFTVQYEIIDELKYHINQHESAIEKSVLNNPVGSDHRKVIDHTEFREKMTRFEELFAELRRKLLRFLANTL
ncbi:MAG: hypothetical protein ABI813_06965 [Bacteroidota bacterium]